MCSILQFIIHVPCTQSADYYEKINFAQLVRDLFSTIVIRTTFIHFMYCSAV